jgi:hypothetical protein
MVPMTEPVNTLETERLLLALCRRHMSVDEARRMPSLLGHEDQREALLRQADDHRVKGLVLRRLAQEGVLDRIPTEAAVAMRAELTRLERIALFWNAERDRVMSRLKKASVRAVMLKGAALRETVHQRPEERRVRDLDLLFDKNDVPCAMEVLKAAGYRSELADGVGEWFVAHHFHLELTHPAGFVVEVHWGLTRPAWPWQLDPARVLNRARPIPGNGAGLLAPSDEDMIVHLASQGIQDHFRQMRRLVDIDRIIALSPGLDWAYVWDSARAGQLEMVLSYVLHLCRTLLDTPVPEDFLAHLKPSRLAMAHLALTGPDTLVLDQRPNPRVLKVFLRFWMARRWRDRSRILAAPLLDASHKFQALHGREKADPP